MRSEGVELHAGRVDRWGLPPDQAAIHSALPPASAGGRKALLMVAFETWLPVAISTT
ncbi:hypothetical protein [Streptomyces turgidiscabies]|nr:hypothetical protein [Streptomyces turgidiscabies]